MVRRVFLDWSGPLLGGLTEWLASGWEPADGALDLSGTVVVLPTAGAGRRLRKALAALAEARHSGVLAPVVVTPEVLIAWGCEAAADGGVTADRGVQVLAWAAVLSGLDLEEWRALFPVDPVSQDLPWAMGAAEDLLKLRRTLEEGGRNLAMAARTLGPENPEAARWEALVELEKLAVERLESGGWRDPVTVRLAAAAAPVLPDAGTPGMEPPGGGTAAGAAEPDTADAGGTGAEGAGFPNVLKTGAAARRGRRVVLAGVPDSIQLTRLVLGATDARGLAEVTVVVHAPASLADTFDLWGRPKPEVWMRREIHLPEGSGSVFLTSAPADAAALLMDRLTAAEADPDSLAIGSADQEISAPLRRLAAGAGIRVFDPEGLPLPEHEVSWLVRTLTRLMHSGSWAAAGQILRMPDALAAAAAALKVTDGLRILEEWDAFQAERLPQNLAQAAPLAADWAERTGTRRAAAGETEPPVLPEVIAWLRQLVVKLKSPPLPEALLDLLELVYSGKKFASGADRQRFVAALTAWRDAVVSVEEGSGSFLPRLSPAGRLDLAAALVRDARLYTAHVDEARALHGWLELPWQDAPHLVIAGMNEGLVPDSVLGDAWLPDSVRAALDLKTNDTRLARDSYLLTAMIESRRGNGSVRLITGRLNAEGDPLKPSRLLLRCPPEELPERALRLFPKESAEDRHRAPAPPWQRAWRLKTPPLRAEEPVFRRLSVTAFADYLECPFRFYLKHVLRMEEYDAEASELDGRAAGNLFHSTMEDFHKERGLRDSRDAGEIADFLHARFDARVERMHGAVLTLPVTMQLEVIRNCLARAAGIHAEESAKGWRFREVELTFPLLVRIRGTEIRGRIDLIQQHPEHGYRILDYKTSSKAVRPAEAHLKSVRSREERERRRALPGGEWATVEHGGKFYCWKNLQLPLYARIMAAHYGVERVAAGYISLPRAVSESRLEVWGELDQALLDAAWACADGVVDAVQRGIFWPPAAAVRHDAFESLIFQGAEPSFDPAALLESRDRIASGLLRPVTGPV